MYHVLAYWFYNSVWFHIQWADRHVIIDTLTLSLYSSTYNSQLSTCSLRKSSLPVIYWVMTGRNCSIWWWLCRISGFLDGLTRIGKFAARWDDDLVDRINHRYSAVILIIFTVIVSTKQYVGEPIVCWCPAQFESKCFHISYCSNMCLHAPYYRFLSVHTRLATTWVYCISTYIYLLHSEADYKL